MQLENINPNFLSDGPKCAADMHLLLSILLLSGWITIWNIIQKWMTKSRTTKIQPFLQTIPKKYAAFATRKDIALPLNTNTLDDDDESEKEEEDDDNEETNSEEDSDDSEDEGYIEAYCENFRNKSGEGRLQTSYYS